VGRAEERRGTEATDDALIDSVQYGNDAALAEIYRRHAGPMLRLAERLLGDTAWAEDVVQETFVRLWQQPGAFDINRGSLRSYLLAMVYGRAIDRLRSDGSRRRRERNDAFQPQREVVDDVHDEVWRGVVVDQVRAALEVLTDGEAEAIMLAYYGGFSYHQVAVLLGQPEGTTKARIRSGLHRMRARLTTTLAADDGNGSLVIDLRDVPSASRPGM